jgi:hypothetical protein
MHPRTFTTVAVFSLLLISNVTTLQTTRSLKAEYTGLLPSGITRQLEQGPTQYSLPGDSVTGRVVREDFDSKGVPQDLVLDASPCDQTQLVGFTRPYEKEVIGDVECSGKKYQKARAVQR